jgi:hypothetical protein
MDKYRSIPVVIWTKAWPNNVTGSLCWSWIYLSQCFCVEVGKNFDKCKISIETSKLCSIWLLCCGDVVDSTDRCCVCHIIALSQGSTSHWYDTYGIYQQNQLHCYSIMTELNKAQQFWHYSYTYQNSHQHRHKNIDSNIFDLNTNSLWHYQVKHQSRSEYELTHVSVFPISDFHYVVIALLIALHIDFSLQGIVSGPSIIVSMYYLLLFICTVP